MILRSIGFRGGVLAALMVLTSAAALAEGSLPPLHRGFNAWPWLHRAVTVGGDPRAFDYHAPWPYLQRFTTADFESLHRMGADFIRVPVDPSPFLAATEQQRLDLIDTVVAPIRKVTATGLSVIIDLHPRESVEAWRTTTILGSDDLKATYKAMLVDFAKALDRGGGGKVVLELMNEPPGGYGWRDNYNWLPTQVDFVKAVRQVAPTLPILVEGDKGGGIDGLLRLDPSGFEDPAIFYSFHYYDPMVVTHQGATWGSSPYRRYLADTVYPPDPGSQEHALAALHDRIYADSNATDKDKLWKDASTALKDYYAKPQGPALIAADFARVTAWARQYHIPSGRVVLGEFGVYRPGASVDTVVHYAHDVRQAAEAAGFAWSYYNYTPFDEGNTGFSVLRMQGATPNAFDPDIIEKGLGLKAP